MNAKLAFIAAHLHAHDHCHSSAVPGFGVTRSWFHAWRRTAPDRAARTGRLEALVDEIRAIFEDSKQRYGAPRIHAELRDRGSRVSRKTVAKLMKLRRHSPASTQATHAHDYG